MTHDNNQQNRSITYSTKAKKMRDLQSDPISRGVVDLNTSGYPPTCDTKIMHQQKVQNDSESKEGRQLLISLANISLFTSLRAWRKFAHTHTYIYIPPSSELCRISNLNVKDTLAPWGAKTNVQRLKSVLDQNWMRVIVEVLLSRGNIGQVAQQHE